MPSKKRHATRALLCLLLVFPVLADTLQGRVARVIDGDTVVLLDASNQQHRIRLAVSFR
jgi:endonuclease YncB( thermonuclease family)